MRVLLQQYMRENDKTLKVVCKGRNKTLEKVVASVQCHNFDKHTCLCYGCMECNAIGGNSGRWSAVLRALQSGDLTETWQGSYGSFCRLGFNVHFCSVSYYHWCSHSDHPWCTQPQMKRFSGKWQAFAMTFCFLVQLFRLTLNLLAGTMKRYVLLVCSIHEPKHWHHFWRNFIKLSPCSDSTTLWSWLSLIMYMLATKHPLQVFSMERRKAAQKPGTSCLVVIIAKCYTPCM